VRRHAGLLAVTLLALGLRVETSAAYGPALFFPDSVGYIETAFAQDPVGFAPARPSGYSLAIRGIAELGGSLATITWLQHLAGLLVAAIVYVVVLRLGAGRLPATVAAAVVALDAYAIALEQHVMAESFSTLLIFGALALTALRPRGPLALGASGALLAAAATMRSAALFAVPVWLVYLAWSRIGWVRAATAVSCLVAPLLVYACLHQSATSTFGLTQSNGWFLYGRVGAIADCRALELPPGPERRLCNRRAADRGQRPPYYIFNDHSPARRLFGWHGNERHWARVDAAVGHFALEVIGQRPIAYAGLVATDFARFFTPGVASLSGDDKNVTLPPPAETRGVQPRQPLTVLGPPVERPRAPEATLRDYARVAHTPRWLMAALALAGVASVLVGVASGGAEVPRRREVGLLVAAALAMLLGSAATSDFTLRYLLPSVPLLAAGGAVAVRELASALRLRAPLRTGRRHGRVPAARGGTAS
jgi:hypothetical protein